MHERGRWGTGDPKSGVGGTVETKKRGRGNVVSPGPFSWPAPAARRVIASPRQASRVRPLLHTIPLAPLPFSYLLSSPLLSAMPGARSGPSVLPLLLSNRSWITTRFHRDVHRALRRPRSPLLHHCCNQLELLARPCTFHMLLSPCRAAPNCTRVHPLLQLVTFLFHFCVPEFLPQIEIDYL